MFRTLAALVLVLIPAIPRSAFAQTAQTQRALAWMAGSRVFRSKYYIVRTDFSADEAAEHASHMDQTCEAYMRMFQGLNPVRRSRLQLFMFREQEDYSAVLRHVFKADPTGSQGMCITRGNEMALVGYRGRFGNDRFRRLMQHEGFHQFASLLFPKLPTWANEGLAEVFERGVDIDGTIVVGEVLRTIAECSING